MSLQMQFALAWRNLWRNRRRSLVTIMSLAFGFAAVSLFAGYTSSVYMALSNAAIHGEMIGHLTINHVGWETEGKLHPEKYLLKVDEIDKIKTIINNRIPNAVIAPKMNTAGLLSNGKSSTIFIANGIAPYDFDALRGPFRSETGTQGIETKNSVYAAQGLAAVLGLKIGDSASILVSTIHGQANASDVDVKDTINTGNAATNDKLMILPLSMVQNLMDAEGRAELLTVLKSSNVSINRKYLSQDENIRFIYTTAAPTELESNSLKDILQSDFEKAGLNLEVRTWQQMSTYFRQVKGMFDMIFRLMLTVVLSIVVLSVANAMSMSVIERTREIGTLRAIGVRCRSVTTLFICEALLLVIIGLIVGLILSFITRFGVNLLDIRWIPPGNTMTLPIYIGVDLQRTAIAGVVLTLLAIVAAYIPARRAAHNSITESLGHV